MGEDKNKNKDEDDSSDEGGGDKDGGEKNEEEDAHKPSGESGTAGGEGDKEQFKKVMDSMMVIHRNRTPKGGAHGDGDKSKNAALTVVGVVIVLVIIGGIILMTASKMLRNKTNTDINGDNNDSNRSNSDLPSSIETSVASTEPKASSEAMIDLIGKVPHNLAEGNYEMLEAIEDDPDLVFDSFENFIQENLDISSNISSTVDNKSKPLDFID